MSDRSRMTENFYESNDVTFNFVEDSDDIICIGCSDNPEISTLFQRDFSPLCFITHYEDESENPSMSLENLFDIHYAKSKGNEYNLDHVLNHQWIENVKTMLNWVQGTEIYFQALSFDNNIIISIYNNHRTCSHKIDADGFLCAILRIPRSRFHLNDTTAYYYYQRVVCWYNINLEMELQPYIFK
jgi:hypothetical protein